MKIVSSIMWRCGDGGGDGGVLVVINNFMLDISRVATATCEYQGGPQSSDGYVTQHNTKLSK